MEQFDKNMNYTFRENCIFCDVKLDKTYFEKDYNAHIGHFPVDKNTKIEGTEKIPFNIFICSNCKTVQNKYLGDLSQVYKVNHADSTGNTMLNLHKKNKELIIKYKNNITNIIEIGSSKGILSDLILKDLNLKYFIIEPNFFGDRKNKIIIEDYYENVDDNNIDANTIIISHVFEHFYEPKKILEKIYLNKNIKHFFLVWPDLEYYINNNILHVLNTEHIYCIDNNFLIKLIESYGFLLREKEYYKGHSVLFYFNRDHLLKKINDVNYSNTNLNIELYYNNIFKNVNICNNILNKNTEYKNYIWPASIHSLYLLTFGLYEIKLHGMLDNSLNKIGKKMYGTNLEVFSFDKIVEENNESIFIILNGGVFNDEVENKIKKSNIKYLIL